MLLSRFVVRVLSFGLIVLGAGVVSGQDYPNKPIRILTSAGGGGADFTSRQIAQGISGPLAQLAAKIKSDIAKLGKVIKDGGIKRE